MRILASGNLDEEAVRTMVASGAPIDDFAIGTRLDTSADAHIWTVPINSRNMPGGHAASAQRARPPGPAVSRSTVGSVQTAVLSAIF